MGTLTEEIFKNKTKSNVKADDIIWLEVDKVMSHDTTSWLAIEVMKKISNTIKNPNKIIMPFDHAVPPASIEQAKMQRNIMTFIDENKLKNFFQEGVCHQVMIEKGFALPGDIIVGSDSHTCSYGALCAFATGMGSTDVGVIYATGKTWFKIPRSIFIKIEGEFKTGVYAKDLILKIIKTIGINGASYKALEFGGETVKSMSISDRITLSNMATECGAKVGLIESDEKTVKYLETRTKEKIKIIKAINGKYDKTFEFNVSKLNPQIACPHDLDNVVDINHVAGLSIQEIFIGSCTNGRYEDMKIAADILKGKKVNRFTRTIIIPASVEIFQKIMKEGMIKIFQDAGCIVCNPGCGPCLGRHQGTLGPEERALTTMNRNFKGRMGSPNAEIYLGSPATCAASAIAGKIIDPREVL